MNHTKSINLQRLQEGKEQVGRKIGTTRVKKPILKKEFDRLINATHKSLSIKRSTKVKLHSAFTLLYLTGCRVSEIINIHTDEIQKMVQDNEYSLTNATKTKTPRLILFDENREQVKFLEELLQKNIGYLFAKNNSDKPMTVSALKLMMNKFIHSVLGTLYSTHSFRSGYITTAHSKDLSLEHIRQDIGHASIATTARYASVSNAEISRGKNRREW